MEAARGCERMTQQETPTEEKTPDGPASRREGRYGWTDGGKDGGAAGGQDRTWSNHQPRKEGGGGGGGGGDWG